MVNLVRFSPLLAVATTLIATRAFAAADALVVVVENGPLAGTYNAPSGEIICLHERPPSYPNLGYAVTWRRFKGYGPKILGQAAVEVLDKPGVKYGTVTIEFGDPDDKNVAYEVFREPVTFKMSGKDFTMDFEGKTKEGIRLHVTAACVDVEES